MDDPILNLGGRLKRILDPFSICMVGRVQTVHYQTGLLPVVAISLNGLPSLRPAV